MNRGTTKRWIKEGMPFDFGVRLIPREAAVAWVRLFHPYTASFDAHCVGERIA